MICSKTRKTRHNSAQPAFVHFRWNIPGTSVSTQVEDGSTNINLGNYFQEKLNIKPLLPYEGDTIIGAVGVSGGTPQEDEIIASAGISFAGKSSSS